MTDISRFSSSKCFVPKLLHKLLHSPPALTSDLTHGLIQRLPLLPAD